MPTSDPLQYRSSQHVLIAGVDEAGRGPLAGSVFAAAVIFDPTQPLPVGLADSKQLRPKQREQLFETITQQSLAWSIAESSAIEIDIYNILEASLLAMERALHALPLTPEHILIDGNQYPKSLPCPAKAIIRGDQHVPVISAASIIAKVLRDRYMHQLDEMYPHYHFAQHKGYPTKQHIDALQQHGPCPIHRQSFRPVAASNREATIKCFSIAG